MITLTVNGQGYRGVSPESVARRVWGKKTKVEYSSETYRDDNNKLIAREVVILLTNRYGTRLVAEGIVHYQTD